MLRIFRHWWRDTEGVALFEFAILIIVFLLIVAGIFDLGHAFYMKQLVTNASREGARYGVVYRTDTNNNRLPPLYLTPSIQDYVVNNYLSKTFLPSDANPGVIVSGAGSTTGNYGDPLEVTVTATKTWFLLDNFIPSLGDSKLLSATTVMRCE